MALVDGFSLGLVDDLRGVVWCGVVWCVVVWCAMAVRGGGGEGAAWGREGSTLCSTARDVSSFWISSACR